MFSSFDMVMQNLSNAMGNFYGAIKYAATHPKETMATVGLVTVLGLSGCRGDTVPTNTPAPRPAPTATYTPEPTLAPTATVGIERPVSDLTSKARQLYDMVTSKKIGKVVYETGNQGGTYIVIDNLSGDLEPLKRYGNELIVGEVVYSDGSFGRGGLSINFRKSPTDYSGATMVDSNLDGEVDFGIDDSREGRFNLNISERNPDLEYKLQKDWEDSLGTLVKFFGK